MEKLLLESFIKDIIGRVDKGDIIATISESVPVSFEMDSLKSVESISRFGVGLRLFENGKVGNSFINSLDDKEELLKNAKASTELGDKIDFDLPSKGVYQDLPLYYEEVVNYPKEKLIETGEEIVKSLKSIDREAKVSVDISKSHTTTLLANTSGFYGLYRETTFGISASMILVEDGGGLLFVGDGDISSDTGIELERILKNIEWRYKNARKKVGVKKGYFPVIFTPDALGLLLDAIEIAANGKTLFKGISVLANKQDEKIVDEKFSLIDDPLKKDGIASYPFDGEGIIPRRIPVIENGVFKNFIFDLATAKRMNRVSTGHAARNISSLPAPSFSNLIVPPGDVSLDQMISSVSYGLLVHEFLGGGMSNLLAGDFSVNVELGYLIENGNVKGRVKDAMISGNVYNILNSIIAVEDRFHKKGSLYAPHVLFERISVAS